MEKNEENHYKRKINDQADEILKKDFEELEARHRVRILSYSKRVYSSSGRTNYLVFGLRSRQI